MVLGVVAVGLVVFGVVCWVGVVGGLGFVVFGVFGLGFMVLFRVVGVGLVGWGSWWVRVHSIWGGWGGFVGLGWLGQACWWVRVHGIWGGWVGVHGI